MFGLIFQLAHKAKTNETRHNCEMYASKLQLNSEENDFATDEMMMDSTTNVGVMASSAEDSR